MLKAELDDRVRDVERIAERVATRTASFADSPEGTDSMAYQLHNLYGAFEQVLEQVARAFENQVDAARYHTDLLRRMGLRSTASDPPCWTLTPPRAWTSYVASDTSFATPTRLSSRQRRSLNSLQELLESSWHFRTT